LVCGLYLPDYVCLNYTIPLELSCAGQFWRPSSATVFGRSWPQMLALVRQAFC